MPNTGKLNTQQRRLLLNLFCHLDSKRSSVLAFAFTFIYRSRVLQRYLSLSPFNISQLFRRFHFCQDEPISPQENFIRQRVAALWKFDMWWTTTTTATMTMTTMTTRYKGDLFSYGMKRYETNSTVEHVCCSLMRPVMKRSVRDTFTIAAKFHNYCYRGHT